MNDISGWIQSLITGITGGIVVWLTSLAYELSKNEGKLFQIIITSAMFFIFVIIMIIFVIIMINLIKKQMGKEC